MAFPQSLDIFPDLTPNTQIRAVTVNEYQKSLVQCQTELNSLVNRSIAPTKLMVGFCWKLHITCSTLNDPVGYGEHDGRAENTLSPSQYALNNVTRADDIIYRYHRVREPFEIDNRRHSTFGSYTPPYSLATLPIPVSAVLPNGSPFHANNQCFVTFESLKENLTIQQSYYNPWSVDNFNGANRNIGGFFGREGILYHDGVSDFNPQVVVSDWFPSTENWDGKDKRGEYFTVLVHMVIIG